MRYLIKSFVLIGILTFWAAQATAQLKNEVQFFNLNFTAHYKGKNGYEPGMGFTFSYSRLFTKHYWAKAGWGVIHTWDPDSSVKTDDPWFDISEIFLTIERTIVENDKILLKGEAGLAYYADLERFKVGLNSFYKLSKNFRFNYSGEYILPSGDYYHRFALKAGVSYVF